MKISRHALALGAGALLLATVPAPFTWAGDKKAEEAKRPFYFRYLSMDNALDRRIEEQYRLVESDPHSAPLHNDLGNLLAERGFAREAGEHYRVALAEDGKYFAAAYNLGLLREKEGKLYRAVAAYRWAIRIKPGFAPSHFHLGFLEEKRGRFEDAVAEYAKALRIDPAMRDPKQNPLAVQTRLLARASLVNYPRDLAGAIQPVDAEYADRARLRRYDLTKPLSSKEAAKEAAEATAPQPLPPTSSFAASPEAPAQEQAEAPPPAESTPAAPPQPGRPGRPPSRTEVVPPPGAPPALFEPRNPPPPPQKPPKE